MNRVTSSFTVALLALSLGAAGALAQTSAAPGASPDGAPPAAGAIQGGSIESQKSAPGRSSIEGASKPRQTPAPAEKCRELSKTLEEQCLRDLRGLGAPGEHGGDTMPPREFPGDAQRVDPGGSK